MQKSAAQIADDVLEKEKKPSALRRYAPLIAGLGLGGLGYGLSRSRILSNNPVLRKLQQSAGKDVYHTPYDMMGPKEYAKLPWYSKLKRRMLQGPEVPMMRSKGDKWVVPPELKKRINKGEASIYDYGYEEALGKKMPGWSPEARKLKWGRSAVNRNSPEFEDKLFEMQLLNKYAPEAGIRSIDLQKFLADKGIRISRRNPEVGLRAAQKALRGEFPKGFFMKPIAGGAASSGMFPTEKSNLPKLMRDWKKMRPEYRKAERGLDRAMARGESVNVNEAIEKFRKREAYRGHVYDELFKNNLMVQEKIPLLKHPEAVAEKMRQAGYGPTREFRIHTVGGEAVPGLSVPRYYSGNPLSAAADTREARAAGKWFEEQMAKMPEKYRGVPYAADIAPLEGGGYKVIELNPTMRSGVLPNVPFGGQHMYKHLTGRYTPEMSALRGIGLGAAGAGVTAGGQAIADKVNAPPEQKLRQPPPVQP